jgi:hypothetical protein
MTPRSTDPDLGDMVKSQRSIISGFWPLVPVRQLMTRDAPDD